MDAGGIQGRIEMEVVELEAAAFLHGYPVDLERNSLFAQVVFYIRDVDVQVADVHVLEVYRALSGIKQPAFLVSFYYSGRVPYQIYVHVVDLDGADVHKYVVEEGEDAFGRSVAHFFFLGEDLRYVQASVLVDVEVEQGVAQLNLAD